MKRLLHIIQTTLLYGVSLFLIAIYPLTIVVNAEEVPASSTTQPATTQPDPTTTTSDTPSSTDTDTVTTAPSTGDTSGDTTTTLVVVPADSSASPPQVITPSDSSSTATNDSSSTTTTAAQTSLDSTATTGNATVTANTTAGNATSGDASATATVINDVNSMVSNTTNQKATSFVSNVIGDVNGDIILQPLLLKAMLENNAASTDSSNISVNNTNQLTNNINLTAVSGNAAVTNNTTAGSATSGSATTVANIVNIINSMVSANQSFVGTINIYGNLNGDILIAPDFIPQLLANNDSSSDPSTNTSQIVDSQDTQSIINNVSLAAASGAAAVQNNTTAGSATTGGVQTNIVLFNLSGHQIIASDSLLVFVNVLGKWVGVIVDAPAGATAAAIGDGVTTNNVTPDLVVTTKTNDQIVNNITLNSQSGSATVSGNTTAGNATSGNASASANIANVSNTSIGLAGWFGILFINVLGNWYGSFGINTPYGDSPTDTSGPGAPTRVIDFVSHTAPHTQIHASQLQVIDNNGVANTTSSDVDVAQPAVLAATTTASAVHPTLRRSSSATDLRLPFLIGAAIIIGGSIIGIRRLARGW